MITSYCMWMAHYVSTKKLDKLFKMKPGLIGDPDIYLCGKLSHLEVEDPSTGDRQLTWGLSQTKYVQTAIANVEGYYLRIQW